MESKMKVIRPDGSEACPPSLWLQPGHQINIQFEGWTLIIPMETLKSTLAHDAEHVKRPYRRSKENGSVPTEPALSMVKSRG